MQQELSSAEEDALFAAVGRYVVFFQWLEGVVDECLLLLWGHENWAQSQSRLADMSNHHKLEALLGEFRGNPANARGRTRPAWVARFEDLVLRLHAERRHRNQLVHAQYLFHLVEVGGPVELSDRRRRGSGAIFEGQSLSPPTLEAMLDRLARLAMDLNFAKVQLIHDFEAPLDPERPELR